MRLAMLAWQLFRHQPQKTQFIFIFSSFYSFDYVAVEANTHNGLIRRE